MRMTTTAAKMSATAATRTSGTPVITAAPTTLELAAAGLEIDVGSKPLRLESRPLRYGFLFILYYTFLLYWVFKGRIHLRMETTKVAGRQMDGSRDMLLLSFFFFFFLFSTKRWFTGRITMKKTDSHCYHDHTPSVAPEHGRNAYAFRACRFVFVVFFFLFF